MKKWFRTLGPLPRGEADAWFTPGRLACLIAALILAAYPDVVLGSHSFFYRDFGFFGYPLAHYYRTRFWEGEVPLWNPLNNCGLPFVAQWNTMVFYPFSLVYLLFPLPWSLNYFCLGHLLLAGLSMYFLAHRWVGNRLAASVAGLAYAWNGLTLHSLMWPNNIAALAWMPLVVLLVEKAVREGGRRVFFAALIAAVQMLTGAPEIILFTWLLLVGLTALLSWRPPLPRRHMAFRFASVVLLVTGLTAIQMLPFLELLSHSQRDETFAGDAWSMPAWGWANLLVPAFRASPSILGVVSQDEQQWTSSYYLGIGILALALTAVWHQRERRVWFLAAVGGAGLLLALGKQGHVYDWLRRLAPWVGFVRFPVKFVVLALFSVPLLAAYGLDWLQSRSGGEVPAKMREFRKIGLLLGLALLTVLAVACWFGFPQDSWSATWRSGSSRALILTLVLLGIIHLTRVTASPRRVWCGVALLAVFGLDVLTHAPRQNPTVITQAYEPLKMKQAFHLPHGQSRALVSRQAEAFFSQAATPNELNYYLGTRRAFFSNCNLLEDVPQVSGFYSLYLKEQVDVQRCLYGPAGELRSSLADFLSVSHVTSPANHFDWTRRPSPLPLATGGQRPVFANAADELTFLASPNFDPQREVCLPVEASSLITVSNLSQVEFPEARFEEEKIQLEVHATEPAVILIAQTFYPPWKAYVDGGQVRLWRANHAFQALEVPAGRHRVTLAYEDEWFSAGVKISSLTLIICLVSLWCFRNRTRAGTSTPVRI